MVPGQVRHGKHAICRRSHGEKLRLDTALSFRDAMHMPVDADPLDQPSQHLGDDR